MLLHLSTMWFQLSAHLGPYGSSIEDCVFLGLGLCCFMVSHHKDITPGWVECTLCGQWVHDTCMGVTAAAFSLQDDFPCECDCLQNGELKLKSIEYYTTLQVKDLDMDFNMIVDKVAQMHSLRKEFSREANGKNKWALRSGRFGPFTDEFVDTVNTSLITNVGVEKLHLIPNLYMPEV
ncbi:uncharacterized protein LOC127699979 [Mytilus californianus]|uniref:uncharacterized protein LOC127699979 n=1 Tax=Mytilus californianus TaxID=6549 RepID=UPI0022453645|nr:uncharacterized protein LOC127699979 [Mytilus californianus]